MKTYIVTDPGYIMKPEKWEQYCDAMNEAINAGREISSCNGLLSELLGVPAKADHTGYGDWSNELLCQNGGGVIIQREFCADSGMVCVCEYTPEMEAVIREKKSGKWCYALFLAENPVIEISRKDPRWTMIKITDGDSVYSSLTRKEAALLELV